MTTDIENFDQILKFNLPASIYDKLYKAKLDNISVEVVLYNDHVDNDNGFDQIYLNRRLIYSIHKFGHIRIILSPAQLRDLKYRIAYENDSLYVIDQPKFITNDIDDIRHRINLREITLDKNITGSEMNLISFFYQRIGDELKKIKEHPRGSKV